MALERKEIYIKFRVHGTCQLIPRAEVFTELQVEGSNPDCNSIPPLGTSPRVPYLKSDQGVNQGRISVPVNRDAIAIFQNGPRVRGEVLGS